MSRGNLNAPPLLVGIITTSFTIVTAIYLIIN
jgi:hypothetical protein